MSTNTDQSQAIKAHLNALCEQLQAAWAAYLPSGPDQAWLNFHAAAKVLADEIGRVTERGYVVVLDSCCTNSRHEVRSVSGRTRVDMLQYSTVADTMFCPLGVILRHCQVVDVRRIES